MTNSVTINGTIRRCDEKVCWLWATPNVVTLRLKRREVCRLDVPKEGLEITCAGGALWITQAHDSKDHFLHPGERFIATGRGEVVAQGL